MQMTKIKLDTHVTAYPMPVCLVGAKVKGKPNFMAVAWFSKVNSEPPMMMVSLANVQFTAEGIKENGVFSINIPGKDLVAETDYCGLVSGRKADKSHVFKVHYGELKNAPMISECPICFELKLRETIELTDARIFVGEIIAAYADEKYLTDGKVNIPKTEQFLLIESPTYQYLKLGPQFAKAFEVGKKLSI
jgi:flavin reductase (DIM6/NTAB) family NADH-FMN oxidoreductase RutF